MTKIVVFMVLILSSAIICIAGETQSLQYYISPQGNDSNDGRSPQTSFKTIQHGLDIAKPGTTLNLAKGLYHEILTTKGDGTKDSPIVIRGSDVAKDSNGRDQTILSGSGRILNINHSFYQFEGFAIEGQEALINQTYPTLADQVIPFKNDKRSIIKDSKLIYIGSSDSSNGLTGIKIINMYLRGAGGECVRIRNASHHNEISNSVIEYCGMFGKVNGEAFTFHNGEGVYIGTSPKSTNQPMYADDTSSYNIVANNIIHTYGSECFDVKENAHHNSFINNECRYNLEPLEFSGSNIELRGDHNMIEGNSISQSTGWNLKLKSDDRTFDKGGNIIKNNVFANSKRANIHNEASGVIFCGNKVDNTVEGTILTDVTRQCN